MKEAKWLTCGDPAKMLDFLGSRVDTRKLLLLSSACCREVSDLLTARRAREAIEVAERLADGDASREEARHAGRRASAAANAMWRYNWRNTGVTGGKAAKSRLSIQCATAAASLLLHEPCDVDGVVFLCGRAAQAARVRNSSKLSDERAAQAKLVHDIFGNPFRPVSFDPHWRTSDVVDVARGIYEDKAFERMPILADALMDAGCEDEQIIGHCRGDGPHVRGCWVVDLVLGKS